MNEKSSVLSASFSDIRAIKSANIELNGITTICGPNGCGKSSISKLIYGFLYTDINLNSIILNQNTLQFYRYGELLNSICHEDVIFPFSQNNFEYLSKEFWEDIFSKAKYNYNIYISAGKKISKITLKRYCKIFSEIEGSKFITESPEELMEEIQKAVFNLMIKIKEQTEKRSSLFLESVYAKVFEEKDSTWKYQFYEYGDSLIKKNTLEKQHSFDKVIYIDMTESILENTYRNLRFRNDFSFKPSDSAKHCILYKDKDNIPNDELLSLFNTILKGDISHKSPNSDFIFTSNNGESYNLSQCATGIKSFAILEMICKNGHLGNETLIIIDEPEVHLHPQWIIEYARLLILINKITGTKFLLATHNPDFVSALKAISEKQDTNVCFYLGNENGGKYNFENLGTDIEPIFASFNLAFERIYEYSNLE